MAIKFTTVKCPECGANLPIEEGRKQMYCSYCGANIMVTNENEYIYRHINEAEMIKAKGEILKEQSENERKIKEIEYRERLYQEYKTVRRSRIKLGGICSAIPFAMILFGELSYSFVIFELLGGLFCFGIPIIWGIIIYLNQRDKERLTK